MTPESGDPGRDPQLEALYRTGSEPLQPPLRLDDTIRAAARRAVHAGPRRSPDRLRRWGVPLSLAAVMVLSVTVVTMMREEGADRLIADDIAQPRQPLPAAKVELPEPAVEPPPPPAPSTAQMQPLPASPARPMATAKPAQAETEGARQRVREEAQARAVPESRETALAKKSVDNAATAGSSMRDAREDQVPPAAAAPRPLRRAAPAEADAAVARGQLMAPQAVMGAAAVKSVDALWRDLDNEPAEKWLVRLRELRSSGRQEDFERLAAEFRRRFPETPLPADLR